MKSDTELRELRVTDLARGGAGVAREPDGRVIFVPLTAPGDLVRVRIVDEDKRYAQAELVEIFEESPVRQKAPCPVFGICGGCQWQHLPYDLQWATKSQGSLHALARVSVALPDKIDQLPAEQIWEYRNRVQLRGDSGRLGFYRRGSKELVAIDRCWIARPEINSVLDEIRDEGKKLPREYKVEVEVMPSGEVRKIWNSRHAAGGFRQVHDGQNEKLQNWIAQEIGPSDVLLDLFGGAGNLSLPIAGKMGTVHCVDVSVPTGARLEALKNSQPNLVPEHFHFHRSPVDRWLKREAGLGAGKVSAIVDPPREGLAATFSDIAAGLDRWGVEKLVAVGCDPDAWARDVSRWVKRSWKLQKVMLIDLFPQTPHIESVAVLVKER